MFSSAVFKLTLWYVGALAGVCFLFSIPAYSVGSSRLERGAQRQFELIERMPRMIGIEVDELRATRGDQLRRDQRDLLNELLAIDLLVVGIGSIFSYRFAKRTLQPIQEAHAAQVRFTADASHELRTPLAVIKTETEVALRSPKLNLSEAKQILRSNLEEITRLQALSDQLLSLTTMQEKGLDTQLKSISTVIRSEAGLLEKRYKITIRKDLGKVGKLRINEALIRQLVDILVDNAVKYAGSKKPDVAIELTRQKNTILLAVRDKGIGIKEQDLPYIFERFKRGKSMENSAGHGLGLAIANDIVSLHDAKIAVSSRPNEETVFRVYFRK